MIQLRGTAGSIAQSRDAVWFSVLDNPRQHLVQENRNSTQLVKGMQKSRVHLLIH